MTATDELRKLLDERGVEHYDGTESTLWGYEPTGEGVGVYRYSADEIGGDRMTMRLYGMTPEQAIAATLGGGECEWELEHSGTLYDKWRCSECKLLFVEPRCDQGYTDLVPNFCPNCGKAVKR